jgi:uncharacterized membrane protein
MNAAQIHLALNHAPLFLSIIGGGILISGMIKKNESYKSLSLYLLVAAALLTIPVFLTGEGTEELVENLPGVNETAIEKHEDMAKISLIIIIITGAVGLLGIFIKKNTGLARIVFTGALLLSLASFGTMAQTAHLGGLIRHNEIQNGVAANPEGQENAGQENENSRGNVIQKNEKVMKESLKEEEKVQRKNDDD